MINQRNARSNKLYSGSTYATYVYVFLRLFLIQIQIKYTVHMTPFYRQVRGHCQLLYIIYITVHRVLYSMYTVPSLWFHVQ